MTSPSPAPSEAPPPIPARIWKIAAVSGAAAFMAMLDSTVANLALESLREDFDSTLSIVQWVATGYLIALAASLPAAAWLGKRFGYGRVWAWSLGSFVLASALCGLAPDPGSLIAARVLQGLAAGLMVPSGQAVIGASASSRQLGRLMGVLGLVIALGPAVGPALGGLLLDIASWRWLFWINLPLGAAALLAARGLVPPGEREAKRRIDALGLVLLGSGLPLFLFGATEIAAGRVTAVAVGAVLLGVLLALGFIAASRRQENPLIDLGLLSRRGFAAAAATCFLTGANLYAGLLLLPLYLQLLLDQGTVEAGSYLLVMGLGSALALPFAGSLTDRYGAGVVSLAGAAVLLLTSLGLLFAGSWTVAALGGLLVLRGLGLAWAQMPAMTAAYASVGAAQMGDATTLINIAQRLGGAVGALAVVVVLDQFGGGRAAEAYAWAFAALTALSLCTLASSQALRATRV